MANTVEITNKTNQYILNIIAPSGIDVTERSANLGENYGRIYSVTGYPVENVDYGWLSKIASLEGTSVFFEYHSAAPDNMIEVYDKKISELRGEIPLAKFQSEKNRLNTQIKQLEKMVERVGEGEEPVGYLNILLHIQAPTEEALSARIKRVTTKITTNHFKIKLLNNKQLLGLKAIAPYGVPDPVVSRVGDRNMLMRSFIGGFPMASSGLNDKGGFYYGKTKGDKIVILNMWLRGGDRINSNWFIQGPPGIGKSTTLKFMFTCLVATGTRIIILDPEKEYIALANHENIDGQVINGKGGNGVINPLHIRRAPVVKKEDLEEGEFIEEFYQYENPESALDSHIQGLRIFFKQYFGKNQYEEVSTKLEKSLYAVYKKFNIVEETDVSKFKAEDYPILSNLYEYVEEKKEEEGLSEYDRNLYCKLSDLIYPMAEGGDKGIWNGPTTINPTAEFIDINCAGLIEADEKIQRAQFYNLTSWAWEQCSADRTEKILMGLDEGYLFIDPEYPDLMKFLRNLSKRGRKYESGLMFITHSVVDLLDKAVKRYGQAILDTACYKFIMGVDGQNLVETKKILNLTDDEVMLLSNKQRGEGILFAGSKRMKLKMDVSEYFLEMFGSAGGR